MILYTLNFVDYNQSKKTDYKNLIRVNSFYVANTNTRFNDEV